jgi:hypothetical protein
MNEHAKLYDVERSLVQTLNIDLSLRVKLKNKLLKLNPSLYLAIDFYASASTFRGEIRI